MPGLDLIDVQSCLDLVELNSLCGAPKQGTLPSPQLLLFLKGRQLLTKDVVNALQCSLDDVNNVNHPLNMTLTAGWGKLVAQRWGNWWSRWRGGEEA